MKLMRMRMDLWVNQLYIQTLSRMQRMTCLEVGSLKIIAVFMCSFVMMDTLSKKNMPKGKRSHVSENAELVRGNKSI